MSSKVVLLKYVPRIYDPHGAAEAVSGSARERKSLSKSDSSDKTAIVVQRVEGGYLSVQGYPPVHQSEKHRAWSIFQQSAKELLGIAKDTPICTRFADPPHETVGTMSALLRQPSHLINLVVQPIQCKITSNLAHHHQESLPCSAAVKVTKDGRDPYCVFREKYCNSKSTLSRSPSVRQKCDFAEMNRLISQLAEVNTYLQHTRYECELIEERCRARAVQTDTRATTVAFGDEVKYGKRMEHSMSSSSYSSDSGKGSMVDPEALDEVARDGEREEGVDYELVEKSSVSQEPGDVEVERLLSIAQCLNQQVLQQQQQRKGKSPSCTEDPQLQGERAPDAPSLPEPPSQVEVRASFRYGGAYVMWNPVSIDGEDRNQGHKVLGYQVYLDQQLHAQVGGALSSQVELMDMKDGCEYLLQVCTECEGCFSLLTMPLIYRHQETNRSLTPDPSKPPPDHTPLGPTPSPLPAKPSTTTTTQTPPTSDEVDMPLPKMTHCKVAKVHTWLKNRSYSDLDESILHHSKDHTSLNDHAPLHVHFADEICACADDAKSISSSHTSGIVTDYPSSPKLAPACCCGQCNSESRYKGSIKSPRCMDELSMPSSDNHHSGAGGGDASNTSLSSESTLCPSTLTSTRQSPSVNTLIDEPTFKNTDSTSHHSNARPSSACESRALSVSDVRRNRTRLSFRDSHAKSVYGIKPVPISSSATTTLNSSGDKEGKKGGLKALRNNKGVSKNAHRKVPEAPRNVNVTRGREGLLVSWDPVKRDKAGCSNGQYVLGYRVYVGGRCVESVDGALTIRASLVPPPTITSTQLDILCIHVRTRSMSAESHPSNSVTYPKLRHHRQDKVPVNSSLLATYV